MGALPWLGRRRKQRNAMVERQLTRRGVDDDRVLSAMREVPREAFVAREMVEFAYDDAALPIDEGQTISQPYIVALMAEALRLQPEDRVLDVGTGSGYAAAVLSRIAAEVYTIERHRALAEAAERTCRELGYDNVHVCVGDGTLGWPDAAPFDAIAVSASGPKVPPELLEQLTPGGRLVIPTGSARLQRLVRVTRTPRGWDEEDLGDVRFVPLIGTGGWSDEDGRAERGANPGSETSSARPPAASEALPALIRGAAEPLPSIADVDLEPLLDRMADARVVLLGEATHGTSEFYRMRARITQELVERRGFRIVALEADWPDAARVDAWVRGHEPLQPEVQPFADRLVESP